MRISPRAFVRTFPHLRPSSMDAKRRIHPSPAAPGALPWEIRRSHSAPPPSGRAWVRPPQASLAGTPAGPGDGAQPGERNGGRDAQLLRARSRPRSGRPHTPIARRSRARGRLVGLLSAEHRPQPPQRHSQGGRSAPELDADAYGAITHRAMAVLKRLVEKSRSNESGDFRLPPGIIPKKETLLGALVTKEIDTQVLKQLCTYSALDE